MSVLIGAAYIDAKEAHAQFPSGVVSSPADADTRVRLARAISSQLKPKWHAPRAAGAQRVATMVSFDLNRDGTLNGTPRIVRQVGVDDSNRREAAMHAKGAIRAVELAAPFDLPQEYFDTWKHVGGFLFDQRLSR
jgi:hypothetical protein